MSISPRLRLIITLTCSLFAASAFAAEERLLMMRSTQSFPETMLAVQKTLGEYGYTVSRVQRVDIGLTTSGFQTDKYRIVFFGKPEEIRNLSQAHPELIPYLPLKMTLFAEEDETVLVALDPTALYDVVPTEAFRYRLLRWKNDIVSIMDELREE
jgi:uncharacterized protein (DUF302 family)